MGGPRLARLAWGFEVGGGWRDKSCAFFLRVFPRVVWLSLCVCRGGGGGRVRERREEHIQHLHERDRCVGVKMKREAMNVNDEEVECE